MDHTLKIKDEYLVPFSPPLCVLWLWIPQIDGTRSCASKVEEDTSVLFTILRYDWEMFCFYFYLIHFLNRGLSNTKSIKMTVKG